MVNKSNDDERSSISVFSGEKNTIQLLFFIYVGRTYVSHHQERSSTLGKVRNVMFRGWVVNVRRPNTASAVVQFLVVEMAGSPLSSGQHFSRINNISSCPRVEFKSIFRLPTRYGMTAATTLVWL